MPLHPQEIANELKNYAFFKSFTTESLLVFSTMATELNEKSGTLLLEQGKNNDSLFFLRSGILSIVVDGEVIYETSQAGEVFGEMSLINRSLVSATVKAKTDVQLFKVSEAHILSLPAKDKFNFQQLLYRVYAGVLADRLQNTNDKAKRFEIANRELLAAQDELKKINENLEKEIIRRSQEIIHKVHNLTESHLQPVRKTLFNWSYSSAKPDEVEVKKTFQTISEVIEFLKPVSDLEGTDKILEQKKVLLFDSNKKQQNVAKLALAGTGVDLKMASNDEELNNLLDEVSFDLILCEAEMVSGIENVLSRKLPIPVVILVNLDMGFYLQTLKRFPQVNYFVSRDLENKTFTIKNVSTTVSKILNKDLFGMEKYLSWGSKFEVQFARYSDKRLEMIEKMKEHFKSFGVRSSMLDRVHTVTEELLMNAIYDAPSDGHGKSIFNHLPRTEKVELTPEQQAVLKYGTDGFFIAVSVSDPFGGLTKEIVMKYLESVYSGQAGSLNKEKGGAGRGIHMIIENSDLTIYNVQKGIKTEIICLFNLDKGKEEESKPTFHFFIN
jgi:CRP-like cAMP-binding protein